MIKHFFSLVIVFMNFILFSEDKILVTLHGFMSNKTYMTLFEDEFKYDGWIVYPWSYPSEMKTIQEHGKSLITLLEFIVDKHPNQKINFITHSMGGLVLRSAINEPECPNEAKMGQAVLVAPPNQGTAYGRFLNKFKFFKEIAGDYAGRQLLTTEKGGFESLGQFPESMKILVIAGTCGFNPVILDFNDGKVGVEETKLSTPHEHITVFAGHSWISQSPLTVELAKAFFYRNM